MAERRFIDANNLIEEIREERCYNCRNFKDMKCDYCSTADYIYMIEDMPAADVVPVRHGRWIEQEKYTFGVLYDCSICGNRILDNGHSWNYCPNCGADMRGSNDEGVTVREWISVKDRLPEAGGYVVCIAKENPFSRFMPMVARIKKNGWVNPMTEQYISEVTHWMQMPNPPKGE